MRSPAGLILTWLSLSAPMLTTCASGLNQTGLDLSNPPPTIDSTPPDTTKASTKSPAPYAIDDSARQQQDTGSTVKNLVFRLSLSPESRAAQANGSDGTPTEATSADLVKLLDALSGSNNFSSEIMVDERNPSALNITISNVVGQRDSLSIEAASAAESLEEVLNESRSAFNFSSTLKDNHRLVTKQSIRSKPAKIIELTAPITVPPLRQTLDVVAENYTVRKIAVEANLFALKLLHQLNIEKLGSHNIVQSPLAVYQGLSLLLSGSMGDTTRELDRVLLGSQSVHENTKLTHDQDRSRLLASFNEIVHQLCSSATNHLLEKQTGDELLLPDSSAKHLGGSEIQHMIIANNLLFSPAAFEISSEFKQLVNNYYNNTALTRIEVGSTESIQVVNSWIRRATLGLIPTVLDKRSTFDEFNVMTLLSTSWLSQEWHDNFRRVSLALRSNIRLKGQAAPLDQEKLQSVFVASKVSITSSSNRVETEPLLEFIDDNKESHFVDYIKSATTRNIRHYHSIIGGVPVDVVVIPFRDSSQKLVTLTPLQAGPAAGLQQQPIVALNSTPIGDSGTAAEQQQQLNLELPDSSQVSKMLATFASDPRKTMKSLWNTVAPDIITRGVYLNMHQAMNSSQRKVEEAAAAPASDTSSLAALLPPRVRLSMPIIRMDADASLSAALNHIGIVNSFDPAEANFIGINGHPFNYNKLHLSNVLYKTSFNLNELGINYDRTIRTLEPMRVSNAIKRKQQQANGSKSNNEPSDQSSLADPIDEIKLNKPFAYMICDVKSKLVLYTGVLRNPTKETRAN